MAPRRTSFTSSLPPILDGTTFCSTRFPTPPHTPRFRPFRPKLSLPRLRLSLSPPRSPPTTHAQNPLNQQFPCTPVRDPVPPLEADVDESHSSTSSSSDEFEEIFASSPIGQYPSSGRSGSSESGFISSSCTSRSNSPGLIFLPKIPSHATAICSTPPVLGESHVAGLYFMKPLVLGVKLSAGKSHGANVEQGLDTQQVSNCKRASTPVKKTPNTRCRSNSSPVGPPGAAGRSWSVSRQPSRGSANNGKPTTSNIAKSFTAAMSVPPSPVIGLLASDRTNFDRGLHSD
ncbi:hypothetical protein L211DRAFT_408248 [Terfezia boudieri ATCC MYA-4762]|uniref:Uncharacterized protein n=1 Tax=Terfezia boudieri ATCC MYA-4762 TaxID=1051890 RepID=A0A3N4LJG3_9PEZI|nr:hypothetical protein L211DRAFT_408248 [Terfezia boudieri ATCC MYA-4762]